MFLEQDLESLYTSTRIWEREFHQMVILMPLQEYLKGKLFTLYSAYENTQTLANWNLLLLAKYYPRPQGFSLKKSPGDEVGKIFEAMISPILSYDSEIWGLYVKHNFESWENFSIEKTHLKFCKHYLEISNQASNVASRSELGRFSLIINIYKNIHHYILYPLRKNEDTIVKPAFRTSLELHYNGKNSFYHNHIKISEYYDHSKKLHFYSISKHDFKISGYLDLTRN